MSLTEALRAGDPEVFGVLYDEHGPALYAYCHAAVGDAAGDAVRDTFVAAARARLRPPADDAGLPGWLYTFARAECARRDAPASVVAGGPAPTPLRSAVGRLRREHREVLALTATLEIGAAAEVLGVARDTADQMTRMARRRLEQAVLAVLAGRRAPDDDLLAALGRGRLHTLLAATAPEPPVSLRERVRAACAAAIRTAGPLVFGEDGLPIDLGTLFGPAEAATGPYAVVRDPADTAAAPAAPMAARARPDGRARRHAGQDGRADQSGRPGQDGHAGQSGHAGQGGGAAERRRRPTAEAALLAACAAAIVVGVTLWPAASSPDHASTVGGSTVVHRGLPSDRPGPSSTGATSLGRTPGSRGPRPAATPLDRAATGPAGRAPAGAATTVAPGVPSPTRSATPSPRPATSTPLPSSPGLPPVPGLSPSPKPTRR